MLKILAPMTACATFAAAGYSPTLSTRSPRSPECTHESGEVRLPLVEAAFRLAPAPSYRDTKETLKTTSHTRPPLPPFLVASVTHAGTHTPDIPSMSEDRVKRARVSRGPANKPMVPEVAIGREILARRRLNSLLSVRPWS